MARFGRSRRRGRAKIARGTAAIDDIIRATSPMPNGSISHRCWRRPIAAAANIWLICAKWSPVHSERWVEMALRAKELPQSGCIRPPFHLLILDKLSNRSHIHSMGFPRHGCSHEQSARPCGTGSATLRGRAFAATWCEAAGGGAAAQSEPHVGLALGAGAGERAQSVAQDTAHRATAAADRRQEEAIGRRARSRRLGARICYRSVDSGAGLQAHREDQWQAVFAIGRVAAAQGTELLLPAAERSRQEAR